MDSALPVAVPHLSQEPARLAYRLWCGRDPDRLLFPGHDRVLRPSRSVPGGGEDAA